MSSEAQKGRAGRARLRHAAAIWIALAGIAGCEPLPSPGDAGDGATDAVDASGDGTELEGRDDGPPSSWVHILRGDERDEACSVLQTSDGGYVVGGMTTEDTGVPDALVVRMDASGKVLWQRAYGGPDDEGCARVEEARGGGYIAGAYTSSYAPSRDGYWMASFGESGDIRWQRLYSMGIDAYPASFRGTADGGTILSGLSGISAETHRRDVIIIETDAGGDVTWQRSYARADIGGIAPAEQTADGGYLIAGSTYRPSTEGDCDAWVLRLDGEGNVLWHSTYDTGQEDIGVKAYPARDGGIILTGIRYPSLGDNGDIFVAGLDEAGSVLWSRSYGGTDREYVTAFHDDAACGLTLGGTTHSLGAGDEDMLVFCLDGEGIPVWARTYGGEGWDTLSWIGGTSDGGHVMAGSTGSFGAIGTDLWVLKTDEGWSFSDACPPGLGTTAWLDAVPIEITRTEQPLTVAEADVEVIVPDLALSSPPIVDWMLCAR